MRIQSIIDNMTLEEKVGQICVPIFQKGDIDSDLEKYVKEYKVGMLRFCPNAEYDGNSVLVGEPNKYRTAGEMTELLNNIQKMSKIPLFIAVDQEGSIRNDVNRAGAFAYSGHMSFGAADDTELTYKVAYAAGKEFRAMGINLVQAPIVDVLTYQGRRTMKSASFGENVEKVTAHALAMMKGYQDAGIAAMAKHFPGYGSVATDAHKGLAEITKDFAALDSEDIAPMKVLFENGVNGVMTGHVLTHAVDGEYPATLSEKMIKGYLRGTLGFDGIVETDAMRMPAIQKLYGTGEASVMAVKAGCDLVLLRGDMKHFEEGYFAILKAAQNGELSIEDIDASVMRILRQKEETGLLDDAFRNPKEADEIVGCMEHKALAGALAERSVSVLKNGILPVEKTEKIFVICAEPQKLAAAMDEEQSIDMLGKAVAEIFPNTDYRVVALNSEQSEIEEVTAQILNYDKVIIASCNAILYEGQAQLINEILKIKGKDTIVVAMDSPYDYEVLENCETYIATYGVAMASAKAAAKVIEGTFTPTAVLPVTINL